MCHDLCCPGSLIESIDPTIRVARGFTCSSVEDLLGAYALLQCERVVVKPIHGAAGEGILFLRSEAELRAYSFPMGDVCLEEHLALDVAPDGVVLSPALHYNEGELVGSDLVDQIMNGTAYMGWRRTVAPAGFQERAREVLRRFMERARPRGPGGVDFLSVGGEPYLSDLNTVGPFVAKRPSRRLTRVRWRQGRFNGCHGPKLFRLAHAPESELYVWKGRAPKELPCAVSPSYRLRPLRMLCVRVCEGDLVLCLLANAVVALFNDVHMRGRRRRSFGRAAWRRDAL